MASRLFHFYRNFFLAIIFFFFSYFDCGFHHSSLDDDWIHIIRASVCNHLNSFPPLPLWIRFFFFLPSLVVFNECTSFILLNECRERPKWPATLPFAWYSQLQKSWPDLFSASVVAVRFSLSSLAFMGRWALAFCCYLVATFQHISNARLRSLLGRVRCCLVPFVAHLHKNLFSILNCFETIWKSCPFFLSFFVFLLGLFFFPCSSHSVSMPCVYTSLSCALVYSCCRQLSSHFYVYYVGYTTVAFSKGLLISGKDI